MKKEKISISEIHTLCQRMRDINDLGLDNIDFLDNNGNVIILNEQHKNDWKFTALNIIDFIDSEFYLNGFEELNED